MSKAIIAGSINMDIVVYVDKHPRVGETIFGREVKYFPGGKGSNQAVACKRLGCETMMVGRVGADEFGSTMVNFLRGEGIDTGGVLTVKGHATGTAFIVVDSQSENSIIVISGANKAWGSVDRLLPNVNAGDLVLAQFEVPDEIVLRSFNEARSAGARTILNPTPAKKCSKDLLAITNILVVNEIELQEISGISVDLNNDDEIFDAASALLSAGLETVVVTLGSKGVRLLDRGQKSRIGARPVKAVDTTGAGDCFIGAFTAGLIANYSMLDAVKLGNVAASISVTREGAASSIPTLEEVKKIFGELAG